MGQDFSAPTSGTLWAAASHPRQEFAGLGAVAQGTCFTARLGSRMCCGGCPTITILQSPQRYIVLNPSTPPSGLPAHPS